MGDFQTPEKFAKAYRCEGICEGTCAPVLKREGYLSWDEYFMSVAFLSAMRSKDPSTQVGFIRKLISTPQMPPADILYAFEVYYKQNPTSVKKYAMVLKELYDADLVKEEQLLAHYGTDRTTDGFEAAKAAAKPFLEWLEKDDEESDDDSDDGSDDGSDVDVDD